MAITKLEIENLTAFERAAFEFVPGINVLLGTNSTGKTHALKWLYAGVKVPDAPLRPGVHQHIDTRLADKIQGLFVPTSFDTRALVRTEDAPGRVLIEGANGVASYDVVVDSARYRPADVGFDSLDHSNFGATFLPSREVLTLFEGFIAAYTKRELSFDETYLDACIALGASLLRLQDPTIEPIIKSLEELLGGKVELQGERFQVTFASGSRRALEAHLVAEGLRKIASLARLLQNGSIVPGGLLVWDEPEANLNARLVAALVPILEALAAAGVQIVLATHDYLLAKRLSLRSEASDEPVKPVKFFLLSRPGAGAPVEVASGSTLADLPRTPMEEEFLRLYEDEVSAFREGR